MSRYDLDFPWRGVQLLSETGGQLGDLKLDANLCKLIDTHEWYDETWRHSGYKKVFKTPEGYWGLLTHIPAGWSSWTYDPHESATVIQSTDFQKFWDLVLDNRDRDDFYRLKAVVENVK